MVDLTGQILGDRYRVEDFLGRGGMADVYKVRDLQRAVFLAMKVLHSDLAHDQIFWRRFEREARTLELLQHPNIVRFYGLEKANRLSFILMDYIDGLTLSKELFLYKNPLPPARVLEIAGPVCAALYFAHNMGMVHCDIKPGNIMIHRNGTVYLTDFGIARVQKSTTQQLTGAGTPTYMAPEQFDSQKPSPATDIYALGVVLFEMLTGGKRPYTGDEAGISGPQVERIAWEKRNLPIPSPRKHTPRVSAEMQAVVMHCLNADPQQRFPTALDLLHALEKAAGGSALDDEAETRVDLPQKAAQPARAARDHATSAAQTKKEIEPAADKPLPAAENQHSTAEKPLPVNNPVLPAVDKAAPAPAKPLSSPEKPKSAASSRPAVDRPADKTPPSEEQALPGAEKTQRTARNQSPVDGRASTAPKQTPPPAEKPGAESGKGRLAAPAASSSDKERLAAPAAGEAAPPAGKPPLVVEKPISSDKTAAAVRKTGARKPPEKRVVRPPAQPRAGVTQGEKSPRPQGRPLGSLPRKWRATPWLMALSAGLVLALIGLALVYGKPPAAMLTGTPTFTRQAGPPATAPAASPTAALPAPATASGATSTQTGQPAKVELPTDVLATAGAAATATSAGQPTPLGGGGQVAFASDRSGSLQIWVMDPGAPDNPDKRQQITDAPGGACQPAWSPDAAQIAFTTPCKGPSVFYPGSTIRIIRLADKTVTDLPVKTPGIAGAFDPAWSPDGLTLAYTAILGDKAEIRAINLNNMRVSTLTNRGTRNAQPAWSPDGKHIAYIFSDSDKNWDALWSMSPTGESQEPLARSERFSEPAWSPDGKYLLASVNKGDNIPLLALVDSSSPSQAVALLLPDPYRMSHASFSPDGQWVVFWTERTHSKPEIMLASIAGKQVRQLTNNNMSDFQPAWSSK